MRHVNPRVALRSGEPARGTAVLIISDNGPGIPSAERSRAFERFYRIPGSPAGGSGLGLSIVGRVVELLAGESSCPAPASGTGLVVIVRCRSRARQGRDQTAA